jgi:hypothetical protein
MEKARLALEAVAPRPARLSTIATSFDSSGGCDHATRPSPLPHRLRIYTPYKPRKNILLHHTRPEANLAAVYEFVLLAHLRHVLDLFVGLAVPHPPVQ